MSGRIFLLGAVCLLFVGTVNANGNSVGVLDSLIQTALNNNPEIRAAEYDKAAAEYQAKATGIMPDPQLSISAMNLPRTSLNLGETPMSGIVLGVSQMVPWPAKLKSMSRMSNLAMDIKAQDVTARENSVIRMVTETYYEYSYWAAAGNILDKHIGLTGSIGQIAETKYANGNGPVKDVLQAQTSLARMQNRKLEIDRMRHSALLLLGLLVGDSAMADSSLTPFIPEQISEISNSGPNEVEIDNPRLHRAGLMTQMAGVNLSLSKIEYWPELMFGFNYTIRKNSPMDGLKGEDYLSFMLGVKMPVWFFKKQRNQTRSSRQALAAAEYNQRAMELEINRQIDDVKLSMETIRESLDNYRDGILPRAQAAYEATEVAYEVGKADFDGLLMAQKNLLDVELEKIGLLKTYHRNVARFHELMGHGRTDGR